MNINLDAKQKRNLFMFGIILLALNNIVWTRGIVSTFLQYNIIGEVNLATILGMFVLYGAWAFKNYRVG